MKSVNMMPPRTFSNIMIPWTEKQRDKRVTIFFFWKTYISTDNTNDALFSGILKVYRLECLDKNTVENSTVQEGAANCYVSRCTKIAAFLPLDVLVLLLFAQVPLDVSEAESCRFKY